MSKTASLSAYHKLISTFNANRHGQPTTSTWKELGLHHTHLLNVMMSKNRRALILMEIEQAIRAEKYHLIFG
jgi:hypothetical protein